MTITATNQLQQRLQVSNKRIAEFCDRWQIVEFAIFGSVLRDDFRADSDIDVLVTLNPDKKWSLFDLMDIQSELELMFGRSVDLVEKRSLKNPFRKAEIMRTHQVIYARN
ncbi:MAG: nucleotidyltransferase family protein [Pseudanabaena sp. ELA607]|jgi:predicted nucleotidyltransferase